VLSSREVAVADENQDTPRPFDVKTVEYLLRLMSEHELSEVDLKEGDQRIRLRKGSLAAPVVYSAPAAAAPVAGGAPTAAASPPPPAPAKSNLYEIKSDLPGTFYTRPAPDKPEFVKVGSVVKPDTVVCFVSAMKVNTPIQAGVSGTIAEVVAKNDEFVDYGAVLFRVTPS
jgi:acetyl-CoA carboxylase biotin carboxyl carrier protein